jgi:DNA-binding transcriptional LysR family regulator
MPRQQKLRPGCSANSSPSVVQIGSKGGILGAGMPPAPCRDETDRIQMSDDRTADAGFVFGEVQDSDIGSQYLTDVSLVVVAPLAANAQLQSGTWTAVASLPWIASTIDCPFEAIGSAIFTGMGHTPPKVVMADDGAKKLSSFVRVWVRR